MAKKAKGKKKGKAARAARPAKPKRKTAAKGKKGPAKPKRKVKAPAKKKMPAPAAGETAKLREEVKRWQMLHGQLQEQIKGKDSTIAKQMQEIMELKKNLEQLAQPSQLEL